MEIKQKGLEKKNINAEVCVIGGGVAGVNAAISSARQGINTVLINDRPVFFGNASGEVRMWICGVKDFTYKETGLMEEINLENFRYNPNKRYPIWDALIYQKIMNQENLTAFANTTCFDAKMDGDIIKSITAYQMTTQTMIEIQANIFIDCSGDSILAPLTGASFMIGREGKEEFNELMMLSHDNKDNKTMGNSLIMQAVKRNKKIDFVAPDWVERISLEKLKSKNFTFSSSENFWYIELGGNDDTLKNAEVINKRLLSLCLGIWDVIKNSGEFDADYFDLDFIGMLPAKRESRRMLGDYVLTGNDLINRTVFDDEIAYGGWPMDDHNPDGIDGTISNYYVHLKPYGIPFRCLYSKNIKNLMFAGRNISMTHLAMSSARVMGTCGCLGQAAGVGAAVACKYNILPSEIISKNHIKELQQILLFNDSYLLNVNRIVDGINSSIKGYDILRNGADRNINNENRLLVQNKEPIVYKFDKPTFISNIKIVFDSDLKRDTYTDCDQVEKEHSMRCFILEDSPSMGMPKSLAKDFEINYISNGEKNRINCRDNLKRNVVLEINDTVSEISLNIKSNWGLSDSTYLFTFECYGK